MISVVMPAHDEASVVARGVRSVLEQQVDTQVELVVVANGCTDDTADRARAAGAAVVVVEQAGKHLALNAGDAAVSGFPRVFVDADVELSPGTLQELARCLDTAQPRIASPRLVWQLTGCSLLVRAFFRTFTALPYMREGLIGGGCYAVNEAGRRRFVRFPSATADDLFVQGLFEPSERVVLRGSTVVARAPRDLRGLLAVRTRTYLGNREAQAQGLAGAMSGSRSGSLAALRSLLLRQPWRLLDVVIYLAVNLVADQRARRRPGTAWLRDTSTR